MDPLLKDKAQHNDVGMAAHGGDSTLRPVPMTPPGTASQPNCQAIVDKASAEAIADLQTETESLKAQVAWAMQELQIWNDPQVMQVRLNRALRVASEQQAKQKRAADEEAKKKAAARKSPEFSVTGRCDSIAVTTAPVNQPIEPSDKVVHLSFLRQTRRNRRGESSATSR